MMKQKSMTGAAKVLGLAALGLSLTFVSTQDSFANGRESAREKARNEAREALEKARSKEAYAERTARTVDTAIGTVALSLENLGGRDQIKDAFKRTSEDLARSSSQKDVNGVAVMHEVAKKLSSVSPELAEHLSVVMSANARLKVRLGDWLIHPENFGELFGEMVGLKERLTDSTEAAKWRASQDQVSEWRKLAELASAVDAEVNKDIVEGQPNMNAEQIRSALFTLAFRGSVAKMEEERDPVNSAFVELMRRDKELAGRITSLKLAEDIVKDRGIEDLQRLLDLVTECTQG